MKNAVVVDSSGTHLTSLRDGILQQKKVRVISFVGGGGKTSTMFALAEELAEAGFRVAVTTTTHIGEPKESGKVVRGWDVSREALETLIKPGFAVCVGTLKTYDGEVKMDPPEEEILDWLVRNCDYVLIEADGSKHFPMKAPADYEPVLLPATDLVVAVFGLSAVGKPLKEVCHRVELAASFLEKCPEDLVKEKDAAALLSSAQGQRKGVEDRAYCVVLNQADDEIRKQTGIEIAAILRECGIAQTLITAYRQETE